MVDWLLRAAGRIYGKMLIWRMSGQMGVCGKIINKYGMRRISEKEMQMNAIQTIGFIGKSEVFQVMIYLTNDMRALVVFTAAPCFCHAIRRIEWEFVTEEEVENTIRKQIQVLSERHSHPDEPPYLHPTPRPQGTILH